ncbi:hypothetical protein ANN_07654 [Periplaneta americana]|uniref:Uncharacterized protein n=1 Tax=Periplaneta americana TaxID=6978 RepID=A0ABQ8T1G7_PERAM|nr:hypothetical protein ANN_07654 [Periplaneta americana]
MAGLCEGSNEPPGSLKASNSVGRAAGYGLEGPGFDPGGDRIFFSLPNFQNSPEVHSASYKIEYRVFPGVKGGQSVVPTTPPHSSAEVMESMGLYLHAPQVQVSSHPKRPEFECGPQLEGPEFTVDLQLEGPEFEYSGLSLKVCGSRYQN